MNSNLVQPHQKVSDSKKDKDWKEANVRYWSGICSFSNNHLINLYKAANGELDETEYDYLTNPLGTASQGRPNLKNFPAKLKNYPIIPPIIKLLMGEKRNRPIISNVVVNNPDTVNRKRMEEENLLKTYGEQLFVNYVNELGIDTGLPSKQLDDITKIQKDFNKSWADTRAILGQHALNYIKDNQRIEAKFVEGFLDWIVTKRVFSYRDAVRDTVIFERISPKNVGYVGDETITFIEDAQAACVRLRLSRSEFLDRFHDILEEENLANEVLDWVDALDSVNSSVSDGSIIMTDRDYNGNLRSGDNDLFTDYDNVGLNYSSTVDVYYVNWKSWTQIKKIRVKNILGEVEDIEVPVEYKESKADGEELIAKYWVNQVWEGYKAADRFLFGIKPIVHQRGNVSNPSKCKLLISGRIGKVGDLSAKSIVETLMPYQHLYNFVRYKEMLIMGKNKEKIMTIPLGLIPKEEGWDLADFFYYVESTGIAFIDDSDDKIVQTLNAIKSIDLSLGNYIQFLWTFERQIKSDAEEAVGINRQRMGEVKASDGLGATQVAQYTSSLTTEEEFAQFDEWQESEFNALLDLSRYAFRKGKIGNYISSDSRSVFLEIDEATAKDYCSADFGVRVSSSAKYEKQKQKLEHYAEALAQNGAKASTLGKLLLHEENFHILLDQLEDIENLEAEVTQNQAKKEQDNQRAIQEMISADKAEDRALVKYEVDQNNMTKLQIAGLNIDTSTQTNEPSIVDLEKNNIDRQKMLIDTNLKAQELAQKNDETNKKVQVEREKMANQLAIAKENKTKAEIGKK